MQRRCVNFTARPPHSLDQEQLQLLINVLGVMGRINKVVALLNGRSLVDGGGGRGRF